MQRTAPTPRWHLLWLAAGLLAAGCSRAQGPLPATPDAIEPAAAARVRSWMAPDAGKLDLLYVSDYVTNDVDAYSFPQGKLSGVLRGVLKGFVSPSGLCTDKSGDVFIPDSSNSTILEYAHGSTHLVRTLTDRDAIPYQLCGRSIERRPRGGQHRILARPRQRRHLRARARTPYAVRLRLGVSVVLCCLR